MAEKICSIDGQQEVYTFAGVEHCQKCISRLFASVSGELSELPTPETPIIDEIAKGTINPEGYDPATAIEYPEDPGVLFDVGQREEQIEAGTYVPPAP